jgi:hypothetical protein
MFNDLELHVAVWSGWGAFIFLYRRNTKEVISINFSQRTATKNSHLLNHVQLVYVMLYPELLEEYALLLLIHQV